MTERVAPFVEGRSTATGVRAAHDPASGAEPHPDARSPARVKVMFLGLRGIGSIQGGVETHVTHLVRALPYDRDAMMVLGRRPYRPTPGEDDGTADARIVWLPALRNAHLEAALHSILGTLYAAIRRPEVLHIHGVGPAIVVPLARMLGLRVVATHHGNDYEREKWGGFARWVLRFGERRAVRGADACIAISPVVAEALAEHYARPVRYLPNGVRIAPPIAAGETLAAYGLAAGRYIVNVARLVPEKRQCDLIEAFLAADLPRDVRLVLIGGADHETDYVRQVRTLAATDDRIILTGHVSGAPLVELFANAGLFVLPSTHEGLPIALLEAIAYGRRVLLSDLPVYGAMGIAAAMRFPVGDVAELARRLHASFAGESAAPDWSGFLDTYRWDRIARETARIYDRVTGRG